MRKKPRQDDTMTLVLVNEMRRMDEAAERVRLVVKAMALRDGVKWELPIEDASFGD
ncbi:hypothetical protein ACWX0K_14855 [Nitrobacteraceae bacterium UC4446_H13]